MADPVTAAGCGESSPSTLGATAEASDTSTATSDSCGNGVIDPDEVCDGDAIPQDADCTTEGHGPGPPGCADDCSALDYSQCPPFVGCGDGVVGEGEECDGTNLAQHECSEFEGLSGPGLACTDQCTLDPSGCTPCTLSGASCVPQQLACCEANETCEGLLSMERCCVNHPCLGS